MPARTSRYRVLDDADWLRETYDQQRVSTAVIARLVGCSPGTVTNALKRHGIARRPKVRHRELADPDWLRHRYVDQGLGQSEIAREVGCAPAVVWAALNRHGIERRKTGPAWWDVDGDWLRRQHHELTRDLSDIATEAGVSRWAARAALQRHGIEPVRWMWDLDENWLREQFDAGRSLLSVSEETGLDHHTIADDYGIQRPRDVPPGRRSHAEVQNLERIDVGNRIKNAPNRPYRSAWRPSSEQEAPGDGGPFPARSEQHEARSPRVQRVT